MVNKALERCSASLAIMEMHEKHVIVPMHAYENTLKKFLTIPNASEGVQ